MVENQNQDQGNSNPFGNMDFSDGSAKIFQILQDMMKKSDNRNSTRIIMPQIKVYCQLTIMQKLLSGMDPVQAQIETMKEYFEVSISKRGEGRNDIIKGLQGLMRYDEATRKIAVKEGEK